MFAQVVILCEYNSCYILQYAQFCFSLFNFILLFLLVVSIALLLLLSLLLLLLLLDFFPRSIRRQFSSMCLRFEFPMLLLLFLRPVIGSQIPSSVTMQCNGWSEQYIYYKRKINKKKTMEKGKKKTQRTESTKE